jgi:hypothetical protein
MKARIFVRDPNPEERKALEAGLRSSEAFVLRRSQILLASARGERAPAIHEFNQHGLSALSADSSRPHHLVTVLREDVTAEMFKALLHRPPRDFGLETSLWTLELLVTQCVRLDWMGRRVSIETMRQTVGRLGLNWKQAKQKNQYAPRVSVAKKASMAA